jgi:hypothetical protein
VLGDVGERAREVRIGHGGHGDQEVIGEVDGGRSHGRYFKPRPSIVAANFGHASVRLNPVVSMSSALVWFRRDLRDFDHAALYHALKPTGACSAPLSSIPRSSMRCPAAPTGGWSSSTPAWSSSTRAARAGGGLIVRHGPARDVIPALAAALV